MGIAIRKMFDGIASRYDFLNGFLSAGRDQAWREKAAKRLIGHRVEKILDLCGGTGDFWKSWRDISRKKARGSGNTPARIGVIADFSFPMLLEARKKFVLPGQGKPPALVRMDALKPCFKDGQFDAILCGFGMRNLDSLDTGIEKAKAMLRPGGIFVTLEFFRPTTWFTRFFYGVLAPISIPVLGGLFSSRKQAYAYLVASIRKFASAEEYRRDSARQGFKEVAIIPCDFGISHIVSAVKAV